LSVVEQNVSIKSAPTLAVAVHDLGMIGQPGTIRVDGHTGLPATDDRRRYIDDLICSATADRERAAFKRHCKATAGKHFIACCCNQCET